MLSHLIATIQNGDDTPISIFVGLCVPDTIIAGIRETELTNVMTARSLLAGGDYLSTLYDAEIHSYSKSLKVYRSDVGGSGLLTSKSNAVKTAMLIRLSKNQIYVTNYEGYSYYKKHKGLFAFDTMYMGLNRVVHRRFGSPTRNRKGRGLCSVCIYFLKYTVKSLHDVY